MQKIVTLDYEIPEFVNKDVKDIIKGLLVIDPVNRMRIKDIKLSSWFKKVF